MQKRYTSEIGHSGYFCGGEEYVQKVVMGICSFICIFEVSKRKHHRWSAQFKNRQRESRYKRESIRQVPSLPLSSGLLVLTIIYKCILTWLKWLKFYTHPGLNSTTIHSVAQAKQNVGFSFPSINSKDSAYKTYPTI